jgi:NAD(P)-dependent dehydrogenase (short-subunit alcohol dehydrogenase family)
VSRGLTPIHLDVTVAEQLAAARTEIGGQLLAGLVNNAGITRRGPLEFVPVDDMRQQMEVNVIGQDDPGYITAQEIGIAGGLELNTFSIVALTEEPR